MAVKNIKCPNCNGELELDDSMEWGFCMYCGSKIMVQDVQKVKMELSGKVEIDESKKAANYFQLAMAAYSNNNYPEAYGYFSKYLENDYNNWEAIFYRGLCAASMSNYEKTRVKELNNAISSAFKLLDGKKNAVVDKMTVIQRTNAFVNTFIMNNYNQNSDFVFTNIQAVNFRFAGLMEFLPMIANINNNINSEMMSLNPSAEAIKKQTIESGIHICDLLLKPAKYVNGFRQIKTSYGVKSEKVIAKATVQNQSGVNNYRIIFVNSFNSLPSINAALNRYENEKAAKRQIIDEYNKALNDFWGTHIQEKNVYMKKVPKPLIIALIASAGMMNVMLFAFAATESNVLFFIFFILLLTVFVLGVLIIIKAIINKNRKNKIEKSAFSSELKAKKEAAEACEIELKNIDKKKSEFAALSMKK